MNTTSPTLLTDGYKIDHLHQYPKETLKVVSNLTPRKSRNPKIGAVINFGLQHYILDQLIEGWNKNFFEQDIDQICDEFTETMKAYTLSDSAAAQIGTDHWRALHDVGYLPLRIKALPEGALVPMKVPIFTVENTLDEFYWLPNFIETDISAEVWPTCTSATTAFEYKKLFVKWATLTGGDVSFVPFQGHDFSYRGMFGRQAAQLSGAAHLTSFFGTDTIPAIGWLSKYYKAKQEPIIGCSVFATEHAVMCVGTGFYIKKDKLEWEHYGEAEFQVFKRLITEVYPTGIVSIVSDTWDLWKILTDYLPKLKNEILARDGKVVIRPDSGDPVKILTGEAKRLSLTRETYDGQVVIHNTEIQEWFDQGYDTFGAKGIFYKATKDAKGNISLQRHSPTPADRGVVELLWNTFGGTEVVGTDGNKYKLLDPHIGAIYGDSITLDRADEICAILADKGYASTNWVAGIGSFTYTFVTRDTYGFAMKATYAEVELNGLREGINIFKDPTTDDGTKKSARGLIKVEQSEDGQYSIKDQVSVDEFEESVMHVVFEDGEAYNVTSLTEIRARINALVDSTIW